MTTAAYFVNYHPWPPGEPVTPARPEVEAVVRQLGALSAYTADLSLDGGWLNGLTEERILYDARCVVEEAVAYGGTIIDEIDALLDLVRRQPQRSPKKIVTALRPEEV